MKKRIASAILALCLLLPVLPVEVKAADSPPTSGSCGDKDSNVTWRFSHDTLTISGSGDMANYTWPDYGPWYSERDNIRTVVIEDGVTSIGKGAFSDHTSLTSITIPNSVTSIGKWAFYGCNGLTTVALPDSLNSIIDCAFMECRNLTSIVIPDSVTSIGNDAFYGCNGLTTVTLPNSLSSMGTRVFGECTSLTNITIPDKVTSIEVQTFENCKNLTSITIPNNVASIGSHAFMNCTSLTNVTLSSNLASIEEYAFKGCSSLSSVDIPDSVTSIGIHAFQECSNLTSISIPDGLTGISSHVFEDCGNLISVTIPNSVKGISMYAFNGCSNLKDVYYGGSQTEWNRIQVLSENNGLTSAKIHYASHSVTFLCWEHDHNPAAFQKFDTVSKATPPDPPPTSTDYTFEGWYKEPDRKTPWDFDNDFVEGDITLYAKWTADTSNGYTITFKTIDETGVNEFTTMRTGADGKLTGLPQFDDPNNYGFAGWYTDSNDGEKVTTDTVFTQNTDVFAHWNDYFTVTFYEDAPTYNMTIQMVQRGKKATKPADPVKADYTFQGWYTLKRVDNDEIFDKEWNFEDVVTKNLFLCAKWEKNTTNPDDTKKTYTITFNADGGKFITGRDVVTVETDTQGKLANFPEVTRDGYDFVDWHNDQIGVAGKDTVFTSDTTLYAHWNKTGGTTTPVDPDPDKPDPPKTFTVTFDPNGGTVSPTSAVTAPGGGPVTMPTPTRTGYSFDGWFTAASGGEKVLSDKTFSQNTTIYAHWTQNTTPAETRYRIYTPGSVSGGSYDVSRSTAAEGTRVTIELSPRSGYELDVLTVTNLDTGRSVPLTERYSDEYYFTMPASSVDVDISFSRVYPSGIYYDAAPPRAQPGPTAWYYSNRHICHVTNGQVPDGTPITRDMLISVLYNLTDESLLTAPSTIGSKTNNSHTWAVASNITPDIYASGLWGTDKPLSREQLSIMMFQYAVYRGCGTSQSVNISHYSDYDRVRPIAHGALSWALATGLMSSTSNVTLSPQAGITCGQTGELLYRFLTTIS